MLAFVTPPEVSRSFIPDSFVHLSAVVRHCGGVARSEWRTTVRQGRRVTITSSVTVASAVRRRRFDPRTRPGLPSHSSRTMPNYRQVLFLQECGTA